MSKKGLLTLILGGSALAAAGLASSSTAVLVAVVPVVDTPIPVTGELTIKPRFAPPNPTPTRPPGRSLYRPGPRNPPTVLE